MHAGRIDRFDVLGDMASGWVRNVTTAAVDAMIASCARYPFESGGFVTWARSTGLL
ncbi:hypothetical protein [Phytoactinopolyspora halotolerans]|uniref:Uncharacterized protein n=1 Tax=Phytoactinopolyspora halotolerans TaxID=1981512 RepID=A0A6L9SHJ8_9ACTN|nr:hypothetical protein [Phytoactinopolyspora halotolerans]NEE04726.1 hypothetical protein [Phytoactinopolyspora halotolerans]